MTVLGMESCFGKSNYHIQPVCDPRGRNEQWRFKMKMLEVGELRQEWVATSRAVF